MCQNLKKGAFSMKTQFSMDSVRSRGRIGVELGWGWGGSRVELGWVGGGVGMELGRFRHDLG